MGEPVGDEYTAGDDCGTCWGAGKTFGVGDTPQKVYLTWAGLPGDLAVGNKKFIGVQDDIDPCRWFFDDGVCNGNWAYSPLKTTAFIVLTDDPATSRSVEGLLCSLTCSGLGVTCTIS